MKLRIFGLLAITAFVSCLLASAQALAQNAHITNYAYITNSGSNTVSVIDTEKNIVTATIPVGYGPEGVAVSLYKSKIYVTNFISNTVSVIDTATNTVTATIPVGHGPGSVAVNPADSSKIYVAVFGGVSVVNTETNRVTAITIPISGSFNVAVSPDGSKAYVANTLGLRPGVSVIDTVTNTVIAFIPVSNVSGLSVIGSKVYVVNFASNSVSVIDTASNRVTATIPVGRIPIVFGVFIKPAQITVTHWLGQWQCSNGKLPHITNGALDMSCAKGASPDVFPTDTTPLLYYLSGTDGLPAYHATVFEEIPGIITQIIDPWGFDFLGLKNVYAAGIWLDPQTGNATVFENNDPCGADCEEDYPPNHFFSYFNGPNCEEMWGNPAGWLMLPTAVPFDTGAWYSLVLRANLTPTYEWDCSIYDSIPTTFQVTGVSKEIWPAITIKGKTYTNVIAPTIIIQTFGGAIGGTPQTATIVERIFYIEWLGEVRWEEWCSSLSAEGCGPVYNSSCPSGAAAIGDVAPAANWVLVNCTDILDIEQPDPKYYKDGYTIANEIYPYLLPDAYQTDPTTGQTLSFGHCWPGLSPYMGGAYYAPNTGTITGTNTDPINESRQCNQVGKPGS